MKMWLEVALKDLEECPAFASEDDMEEPSDVALRKARKLLEETYTFVKDWPEVYPGDEGSIAIDFRNPEIRSGVLLFVERDGSGTLYWRTQSSRGRFRVDDAEDLLREGGFSAFSRTGVR